MNTFFNDSESTEFNMVTPTPNSSILQYLGGDGAIEFLHSGPLLETGSMIQLLYPTIFFLTLKIFSSH